MTCPTWWRLNRAVRLLCASDAPLRTVAHRVGYRSEFTFGAAFKREYGVTRGACRRRVSQRP
ncbi:helix-turn-helix domain-containing protein [Streptomyces sp. NPDC059629]|uniref:helix-turn-helix domain-containing protein n=1 Tax=Streptomyces sp. NPDC059629 TaxID=3346889 RepID=UPI00369A61E3